MAGLTEVERRLVEMGYDLDELERDSPYHTDLPTEDHQEDNNGGA